MSRHGLFGLIGVLASFAMHSSGCISIRPVVVAEKTQLEDEILGSFERLRSELSLPSTASQPAGRGVSPAERRVLQALLDRQYNTAELEPLRDKGVLVELPTGLLGLDERAAQQQGVEASQAQRLIARENAAREVIMNGLIELSPKLSKKDLPQVRAFFHRLNAPRAR